MKIVWVQYTTAAAFAARNIKNIVAIAAEVKALNLPGVRYCAYLMPDGKTFMHLDHFSDEEAHQSLMVLASFKGFDLELHESGLEVEPKLLLPGLVALAGELSGRDFYD